MFKLRSIFLSLNVLNGLLAAAVAAVVFFAVIPFLNPAAIPLPPAKETAAGSGEEAAPPQRPAPADYALISEQNLFHPERKIPPEKQQEKVLPKPELFLYGTLITDTASYAFVEDRKAPHSTAGRGKRQITLKKGESLGGYILREIETNRIVLVKGEERLVVRLDDREKRRSGEAPASQVGARPAAGGMTAFPPAASSFPQAAPTSAQQAAVPPESGGGGVVGSRLYSAPAGSALPQSAPSAAQAAAPPTTGDITPQTPTPTRRSRVEQLQRMRLESQQQGK